MNAPQNIGRVEAIHIAPAATGEMLAVASAHAIAGKGLAGDRYSAGEGTFSSWPKDHEFTLIEAEAIESMNLPEVIFKPGSTRRNVTTRGIALNELIGREFTIGPVRCRGTRLCPPCEHLQKLLGIDNLLQIMRNCGGLRATILQGGTISVGERIEVALLKSLTKPSS